MTRVLLVWPGSEGAAGGNFGVPQLVGLASYLHARTGAEVTLVDLVCERGLGPVDLPGLFGGPGGLGYDVVGFSCYSSFDFLLIEAMATIARGVLPGAVLCAGGYHVSARPGDFLYEGSPFDVAVVGEGERPLATIVASVEGGAPLRGVVLGPDPLHNLDELPETDWSYLERYRPFARRLASQAEIYLSRGCPFDCAFCMEKAKREVSWRGFSVDRAVAEIEGLHRWLDLTGWTLYFADALFGMPKAWRRSFLQKLAERNIPTSKNWLLIRVDMVDDEDLRLFRVANCAPGFGLESGDPALLSIIRKAGRLHDYLDRMRAISVSAARLGVPWGANVIVGHPGETEESLRTSAAYMRELFLGPSETTGFLSVDPFRFYPGSPIDDERAAYEARFGMRIHRPEWWKDGDQAFLSEWVDPSSELDYLRRDALMEEELAPILRELPSRFAYRGPSRPYFMRALEGQIEQFSPRVRLAYRDRYYAWQRYTGRAGSGERGRASDVQLARLCKALREASLPDVLRVVPGLSAELREALIATPRERHVPLDAVAESARDVAIATDAGGGSSVSAMHAYARAFMLAGVGEGMRVLDLGAGTGYGTALLLRLVGDRGHVKSVEIDPALVAVARRELAGHANLTLTEGSALDSAAWEGGPWDAILVGFAMKELPVGWSSLIGEACLVMPLGEGDVQRLARITVRAGIPNIEAFESVRYVPLRTEAPAPARPRTSSTQVRPRPRRALPVVD